MKRLTLFLMFSFCLTIMFSQDLNTTQSEDNDSARIQIFLGVNTINNLGFQSPLKQANEWAFKNPISLGVEFKAVFIENLAFEETISFNKINEYTYYSMDSSLKYYFNDLVQSETFELFAQGGLGLFNINGTNVSANVGGGMGFWFNDTWGIRLKSLGKFAFNANNNLDNNNHFQYFFEVVLNL